MKIIPGNKKQFALKSVVFEVLVKRYRLKSLENYDGYSPASTEKAQRIEKSTTSELIT